MLALTHLTHLTALTHTVSNMHGSFLWKCAGRMTIRVYRRQEAVSLLHEHVVVSRGGHVVGVGPGQHNHMSLILELDITE